MPSFFADLQERDNRSTRRLLLALMAVGFASLIAAGAGAWWVTAANREHGRWVTHTYEVEVAIARVAVLLEQGETTRRGYLISAQPAYLTNYRDYAARLPRVIGAMAAMTADNPRQQARIAVLRRIIIAIAAQRERTIVAVNDGNTAGARALFATESGFRRMLTARALLDRMTAEERWLLGVRDRDLQASQRNFNAVLALAGLLLAAVAALSLLVILRYTRDLGASRDRLSRLNDTLEEQVVERTADLSRANDEIQRFAYIVSHDLRSPLVNVMGFTAELATAAGPLAELVTRAEVEAPHIVTQEARIAAREDLPEAIGFIRTSTQKMDRLINAILKLSREGRRTIAPEPLDIAAIAEAAVGAMRHIIDERGAEITIERPMPLLVSDRLAIEQILSNLIENATKYLQPGRLGRIAVSAETVRNRVIVAVADNGRGIAAADHQRVFDLFRRSGQQDQPGEGIGLAHVRALAYRLGGTIDVESVLGEGATFRLNLPAAYQAPQETPA